MEIRDLLVFVRPQRTLDSGAALAGRLARAHGARVTGVCLVSEPPMNFADCYVWAPAAVGDILTRVEDDIQSQAAPVEAAFRALMAAWGCPHDWAVGRASESISQSAERARLADLVVMDRPLPHEGAALELAQALLMTGGAPCLFAPPAAPPMAFKRVVVGWNGSRPAKAALDASLPLLRAAATVEIARVGAGGPTDGEADHALLAHLGRHGVIARLTGVDMGHGDAGEALLRHCERSGADLLVMGAFGRSATAEAILGGATRTALTQAQLPVLLSR